MHTNLPYRRRYHVDLGPTLEVQVSRRLEHIGARNVGSLARRVAAFQEAYGLPVDGSEASLEPIIGAYHERGMLPALGDERAQGVPIPPLPPDVRTPHQGAVSAVADRTGDCVVCVTATGTRLRGQLMSDLSMSLVGPNDHQNFARPGDLVTIDITKPPEAADRVRIIVDQLLLLRDAEGFLRTSRVGLLELRGRIRQRQFELESTLTSAFNSPPTDPGSAKKIDRLFPGSGVDIVGDPDSATEVRAGLIAAFAYWSLANINDAADQGLTGDDVDAVTDHIDPGEGRAGRNVRIQNYVRTNAVFHATECPRRPGGP